MISNKLAFPHQGGGVSKLALAACLLSGSVLASPAVYTVSPYLGVEGQWSQHSVHSHALAAKTQGTRPYIYGGLRVHPNLALELGSLVRDQKIRPQLQRQTITNPDGSLEERAVMSSGHHIRNLDLRAVASLPLDDRHQALGLLGLGVSHLRLKSRDVLGSFSSAKLVPSVLVGLQFPINEALGFRASAHYHYPMKLAHSGHRVKGGLSTHLGFVVELP